MPIRLQPTSPVSQLPGVGPVMQKHLARMGVTTIESLLLHIPFRYEDYRVLSAIADCKIGQRVTLQGTVDAIANRRSPRRRITITEALVSDESGTMKVVWFNQPFLTKNLRVGERIMLSGRVERYGKSVQLTAPAYEKTQGEPIHVGRLVPVYPTTSGVTQRQLRYYVHSALSVAETLDDPLPAALRAQERLPALGVSLRHIHFPKNEHDRDHALGRLKFDELLIFQLRRLQSEHARTPGRAPAIPFHQATVKAFVASLPFTLTPGQRRAAWEILQDLERDRPMRRLLEGDVGSGKTVVAGVAAINALHNGGSVALLAPTEILARQHFLTLGKLLEHDDVPVVLRTHAFRETLQRGKQRILRGAAKQPSGAALWVGTHALLQDPQQLHNLHLVIIDEQQRFGVEQRETLLKQQTQGLTPHLLLLTATPIPRSLALVLTGDTALSILPGMPKGRHPVATHLVPAEERQQLYARVEKELTSGRQAFVIAPLVEPSDRLGVASATTLFEELRTRFSHHRVGLLHGKLRSVEKDAQLLAFADHKLDLLVATPVVEVGIDVPNATVMVIEGAERFGLAQLHQLRGRVGRGQHLSRCYLVPHVLTPLAEKRLLAVVATQDGFRLSELDLKLRGPGDLVGTLQAGFLDFQYASLGDHALMERALAVAQKIFHKDPLLRTMPLLRDRVAKNGGSDGLS